MGGQLSMHQGAQLGVDSGQHLGELLHLGHLQAADGQRVRHFQADVPGADDDRAGGGGLLQGPHDGERVAHRVQQVHAIIRAEGTGPGQAGDRGPDGDRAGADDELVVAEQFLPASAVVTRSLRPGTSMRRAVVSGRSRIPAASRSATVRWARLRQ